MAAKADGAGGDATSSAETVKDEAKEGSVTEEISPLADESIKSKSKKDKVKKKWSFRSISFGKKDKQKPAKAEEPASPTAAAAASSPTNGEAQPEQAAAKEEAAAVEGASAEDAAKVSSPFFLSSCAALFNSKLFPCFIAKCGSCDG